MLLEDDVLQVCAHPLAHQSSWGACRSGRFGVEICYEGRSSSSRPVVLATTPAPILYICRKGTGLSPDPIVVTAQGWVWNGDVTLVGLAKAREDSRWPLRGKLSCQGHVCR